jgi:hypothetical protein
MAPCAGRDIFGFAPPLLKNKNPVAVSPSCQGSPMPYPDRVPMFQPCYRINDLVEIRSDNPRYARSLPRVPERKPSRWIAAWFRALFRNRKRLRQDL